MSFQSELRDWGKAFKEVCQDERQKIRDNPIYLIPLILVFLMAFFYFLKF